VPQWQPYFPLQIVSSILRGGDITHTVHRQISERRTGSSLHLDIRILEEEEDGLEGIAIDLPYICACYISRCLAESGGK
jgi:hypothetical protein